MTAEKIVVLVCGKAGSGKSTAVDALAKSLNLKSVHSSDVLRQLREKPVSQIDAYATKMQTGFWESKNGQDLMAKRLADSSMDKKLDAELLRIIHEGNVVMDSWTMPWLSKKGFKVWLDIDDGVRLKRIANRDQKPLADIQKAIREKESTTTEIYQKLYGFTFGFDKAVFHFRLDTTDLSESEMEKIIQTQVLQAKEKGFFR